MLRIAMLSCGLMVTVGPRVVADAPLPWHMKYADPQVRFDGIEDHASQVFFLRFLTFSGGPRGVRHTLIEVKNSKEFQLKAGRRLGDMSLLAMERSAFAKRAKEDPSLQWLSGKTEGVLQATIPAPDTAGSIFAWGDPTTTYRVSLTENNLHAMEVYSPRRLMQLGVGVVATISVVWLGVWFVRRRKPPRT